MIPSSFTLTFKVALKGVIPRAKYHHTRSLTSVKALLQRPLVAAKRFDGAGNLQHSKRLVVLRRLQPG